MANNDEQRAQYLREEFKLQDAFAGRIFWTLLWGWWR